jgi:hypothetical protein
MTKLCQWRDHQGSRELLISDFPVNKQRRDHIHIYCRICCRNIVYAQRAAKREMKQAQQTAREQQILFNPRHFHHPPDLRVLKAIKGGAKTQPEIARQARLFNEELGMVLVKLIIEEKKVVSKVVGDERYYEIRSAAA